MLLLFQNSYESDADTSAGATATLTVLTKTNGKLRRGDAERLLVSITPYTAAEGQLYFMAKTSYRQTDDDAIISKSLGDGITIANPGISSTPATAVIEVDGADTKVLRNRTKTLLIELTDGQDHTLLNDTIVVEPEVRIT